MTPGWWSQPFAAEGSPTAGGILRQLGRPNLDELTVLVREAAQNSWDASTGGDVEFTIRLKRLGDCADAWAERLLPGPDKASIEGFARALQPEAWAMIVSDRGTMGLSGPTRADLRPVTNERNDFVQFLRNVGERRDRELGGGTYGFGKGIFYRVSSVNAIVVDTRIDSGDGFQRRIMGAALGADYWSNEARRFTGRHWWGNTDGGVPEPLLDEQADAVARDLGLPGFVGEETGTDVVVLGVDFGTRAEHEDDQDADRTPEETAAHIASAILWHLWPKFPDDSVSLPGMRFSVIVDETPVEIPDPASVEELRPFVRALRRVRLGSSEPHDLTRPPLHAGELAIEEVPSMPSAHPTVAPARPFDGPPHHVARMRQAELVVDYFAGPPHPDPLFAYGGVYRASKDADKHFADSEPPTHDAWQHEGLPPSSKSVVRRARDHLTRRLRERFAVVPVASPAGEAGLGNASRRLSGLVADVRSTAPDPQASPRKTDGGRQGGGGEGGGTAAAALVGSPFIGEFGHSMAMFARVAIRDASRVRGLTAVVDVVVEGGGRETSSPAGARIPQVFGWSNVDSGLELITGATLPTPVNGDWFVVAELHDDVVTRFRLEIEMDGDA